MATLNRALATLRVFGDDLQPDEISRLLGVKPSRSHCKGDVLSDRTGRIAKVGMWRLEATPMEPSDFNGQVASSLGSLTQDLITWANLADRYDVSLFCGWFMDEGNEGEDISPSTLLALGARHIGLALDIYGPEGSSKNAAVPGEEEP